MTVPYTEEKAQCADRAGGLQASADRSNPLGVVIVTYNSADVLPQLLDSLPDGLKGVSAFRVVIVDNESADNSVGVGASHPISATVIRSGRNGGYSAGINTACESLPPDADILILNPDSRLLPGAARLMRDALSNPEAGLIVPKIENDDGSAATSLRREPSLLTIWSDGLLGSSLAAKLGLGEIVLTPALLRDGGPADWATGAALMISAEARSRIGPWDESFFLYSEEVDYMRRAREAGFKIMFLPRARVMHIGGDYHLKPRLAALMTSNRIHYFRRHHGPVATFLFRLSIIVASAPRFWINPGYPAALGAAFKRWRPPPESIRPPGIHPSVASEGILHHG